MSSAPGEKVPLVQPNTNANEEMYCDRKLEDMKLARLSKGYRGDKELINYYDRKIIEIMSIDNLYQVNFSTVKQLIHKLSSETIKNQLRASLEDVKKEKKDLFNTDNYLITLRQLLNMARSYVDEWLDTQALSKRSSRNQEGTNININRT